MHSTYAKIIGLSKIYEVCNIDKNKVLLKNGNVYVNTTLDKIEFIDIDNVYNYKKDVSVNISLNNFEYNNEIMLRHLTKYDAMDKLDKFVDTMIANKVPLIKVVHGKNGGILREAVHEYLKNNKNVKSYRLGDYYEGGIGVTIVLLK